MSHSISVESSTLTIVNRIAFFFPCFVSSSKTFFDRLLWIMSVAFTSMIKHENLLLLVIKNFNNRPVSWAATAPSQRHKNREEEILNLFFSFGKTSNETFTSNVHLIARLINLLFSLLPFHFCIDAWNKNDFSAHKLFKYTKSHMMDLTVNFRIFFFLSLLCVLRFKIPAKMTKWMQ